VPGSLWALAIHFGEEGHWRSWGELLYSVKTGKSAFEQVFGMGLFDWMAQHAEARDIFNAAMTASTLQESLAVVAAYDFSGVRTIVDVGGGHGALIAACLQAYPQLPVFSAKYPPAHVPGKGPQSLAGAPLPGDAKGRSGH
jgi:hypothetical protein